MKKKKKGLKQAKRRLLTLLVVFFGICSFVCFNMFQTWLQIFDNRNELISLQDEYDRLQNQEKQLKSDVNKLQDPDYVARYAREKFLYTKEGETIISINDGNND